MTACLQRDRAPQTCHGVGRGVRERQGGHSRPTVTHREPALLIGLGAWVLKQCIHVFKIPFFRNCIQNQGKKYVLKYFSALFQNFSMLIIENEGSIGRKKMDRLNQDANRECSILKTGT